MEFKLVTISNVRAFFEGYAKMFYEMLIGLPEHTKEQVLYRESKCQDCWVEGHKDRGPETCKYCGCSIPGKWFVQVSCNKGERFPDLMGKEEWEKFKEENDVI